MAEVKVERRGDIALITLDRPERRNALDTEMWSQLGQVITQVEGALPRVVVLTGVGESFCAGMDLSLTNPDIAALATAVADGARDRVTAFLSRLRSVVDRLARLPVPVIAAVNGMAYGGGAEIAARCDLRVLDERATICFSETALGLMPDLGGGVALARLIGPGRAADLILSARRVTAAEAFSLGFANRLAAPGGALEEALTLARLIAENGPRAVRGALEILRRACEMTTQDALDLEFDRAVSLITSGECVHGIQAFLTRQKAVFPDVVSDPEAQGT